MNMRNMIWFGNDADGISMVDFLACGTFVLWIIFKIVHIVLSVIFKDYSNLLVQLNTIMSDVNQFMNIIIIFYFGKKTLDTSITKIGLLRNNQYKMPDPPIVPSEDKENTQG